jgi:hypothetical protein
MESVLFIEVDHFTGEQETWLLSEEPHILRTPSPKWVYQIAVCPIIKVILSWHSSPPF